MNNDIDEIRNKISSDKLDVLKQSLVFVNERISNERVRASRAETRAVAILAYSGVLSGIVVVRLPNILHDFISINWDSISLNLVLIFVLYTVTIIFLLKSAWFAFKALRVLKRYEVTPDLVFDLQEKSENDALREEITYKIWEYYKLLPIGSNRLFWVNRAQRNILASIFILPVLGISWILGYQHKAKNKGVQGFQPQIAQPYTDKHSEDFRPENVCRIFFALC